ncbi:MAG: hypothetical protein HYY93_12275 [Planctomycetes bacterium]|nr:hypothetical protein [Planctomycetota bacterium]
MSSDKDQILADIKKAGRRLQKRDGDPFSFPEYRRAGGTFSQPDILRNGEWIALSGEVGYSPSPMAKAHVPDQEYFDRLSTAVKSLGRLPKSHERRDWGLALPTRRWGGTLGKFYQDAARKGVIPAGLLGRHAEACQSDGEETAVLERASALAVDSPAPRMPRAIPPIPAHSKRKKWEQTNLPGLGFPYAPHDENGVVALFAILCANRTIHSQILELNGGKGIDGVCWDDDQQREIRVELKYKLASSGWNHPMDSFDRVVCWENRWSRFPRSDAVIELRKLLRAHGRIG